MIRLRDLDDDFYEFDDSNYCVIGSRTKRKYTLGDSVRVQVVKCDLLRKQIDMRMVNGDEKKSAQRPIKKYSEQQKKGGSRGGTSKKKHPGSFKKR
jgi:ribonuclease R